MSILFDAAVFATTLTAVVTIRNSHRHLVEHLDRQTNHLKGVIDMSQQDTVNELTEQIKKGTREVLERINDLQNEVAAGVPAEQLDLSRLVEAAQALDDVVPDAPEVPADTPAEVPAEDSSDTPVDEPAQDAPPF